ncbi:hypothetical protein NUSPORA_01617 [Nucleospora cyclopteri]
MMTNNSTLTGLLNNINHEKTKYITLLYKLKSLLDLGEGHKLIVTNTGKLLLTEEKEEIYSNIKFGHPVLKILQEFLAKAEKCVNGGRFFIKTVKSLLEQFIVLLDKGLTSKAIADSLRNKKIDSRAEKEFKSEENGKFLLNELIHNVLKNEKLTELLMIAVEEIDSFDREKVRIIKVNTGNFEDSYLCNGLIVPNSCSGRVKSLENTTISIFNCPLDIPRTELKGTVLLKSAEELLSYGEEEVLQIKKIVDSFTGNALIVSGSVGEIFLDFCDRRNILVLKIFNKYDLERISETCDTPIYMSIQEGSKKTGTVEEITEYKEGNSSFTKIIGKGKIRTIVLKNSIPEILEEYERKINKLLESLSGKKNMNITEDNGFISITTDTVIGDCLEKALDFSMKMVEVDRVRCMRYVLEFLATILEVNDYLVAHKEQLQIKQPERDWDADHC